MSERQTPASRRSSGSSDRRRPDYRDDRDRRTASSRDSGARRPSSAGNSGARRPVSNQDSGIRHQTPGRRNDVIRCENCGEDYAIIYKRCPFCDERPVRGGISGKRVSNTRGGGYGRPASTLKIFGWAASFLVILCAAVIIFRFMGSPLLGGRKDPNSSVSSSNNSGASSNPGGSSTQSGGNTSASNGDTSQTQDPVSAVQSIMLSSSDITLDRGGFSQLTAALLPAGTEGTVTWTSSDSSVATVDESGLVTNVNTGSSTVRITITAACGDVTAECVVYCKGGAGGASSGTRGIIINAEKGLNVRSGPGTTYDKVASILNGSGVTILGEENGWYKIDYGAGKTGYVSKDYVSAG